MVNVREAIEGLQSDNDKIRYVHFNKLMSVAEKKPQLLYPFWDVFVVMLGKPEVSNKYYAIHLIAAVIGADKQKKFEKIFNRFYKYLNHESPVVSLHIAGVSGKIVNAMPQLETKVTKRLLKVDTTSETRHPELMKAYVIQAFDEYFDKIADKKKVLKFIEAELESASPKTKKAAKAFLKKRNPA